MYFITMATSSVILLSFYCLLSYLVKINIKYNNNNIIIL